MKYDHQLRELVIFLFAKNSKWAYLNSLKYFDSHFHIYNSHKNDLLYHNIYE